MLVDIGRQYWTIETQVDLGQASYFKLLDRQVFGSQKGNRDTNFKLFLYKSVTKVS